MISLRRLKKLKRGISRPNFAGSPEIDKCELFVLYYLVSNRTSANLNEERKKLDEEHSNDLFRDYYHPHELSQLDLLFPFNLSSSYK